MIFTERTITVKKGESTINEPVILYRGDYDVEVRFTIKNSKFIFLSQTNLIESEKAAYAQLAIIKPDGENVFSDIAKCEEGTVAFVLTSEMIDELHDVGLYSFQIRLYDQDKESRASIPPVEYGIEIREPIASEDHINSVDEALVGYSIAKTTSLDNEPVGPTFDDEGNYNVTDWETGDRITEGKLNKIEDALNSLNQNEQTLDKKIINNYNVLNATKADANMALNIQQQVDNLVLGAVGDGNNAEVVQARSNYNTLNDRITYISTNGDKSLNVASNNAFYLKQTDLFTFVKRIYVNGEYWANSGSRVTTSEPIYMQPGDILTLKDFTNHSLAWHRFENGIYSGGTSWKTSDIEITIAGDYYPLIKKNDDSQITDADIEQIGRLLIAYNNNSVDTYIKETASIRTAFGTYDKPYTYLNDVSSDAMSKITEQIINVTGMLTNLKMVKGSMNNSCISKFNFTLTNNCFIPAFIKIDYGYTMSVSNSEKYMFNVLRKKENGDLEYIYNWRTADLNTDINKEAAMESSVMFVFRKVDDTDFTDAELLELQNTFFIRDDKKRSIEERFEDIVNKTEGVMSDIQDINTNTLGILTNIPIVVESIDTSSGELVFTRSENRCHIVSPIKPALNQVIKLKDYTQYKFALSLYDSNGKRLRISSWETRDVKLGSEWTGGEELYILIAYNDDRNILDEYEIMNQLSIENYQPTRFDELNTRLSTIELGLNNQAQKYYADNITIEKGNYYQAILDDWNRDTTRTLILLTDDLIGKHANKICLREYTSQSDRNEYRYDSIYIGDGIYMVEMPIIDNPDTMAMEIFIDCRSSENSLIVHELALNERVITLKKENEETNGGEKVLYVSPNGSDDKSGDTVSTALASIKRAIELGATTVLCKRGNYYNQPVISFADQNGRSLKILPYESNSYSQSVPDRPLINLINGDELSSLSANSDGLLTQSVPVNDHLKSVFIDKSKDPVVTGRSDGYNSTIWQLHEDETLDVKIKPVLTKSECINEAGTFFYDGANVYIHPYDTTYTKFVLPKPTNMLRLHGFSEVVLEDIVCSFSQDNNFILQNNMNMTIRNCHSRYTMLADGFTLDNSNANVYNCSAFKSRNDGFNIHGYGVTNFFNCVGYYNYDDGISHHDGCVGIIDGGEWHHNGKGGISSPTHGARNDIYNVECHHNGYGIYAASDSSTRRPVKGRVFNSVLYDNTSADIIVRYADMKLYNTKYGTKSVSSSNATLTEL